MVQFRQVPVKLLDRLFAEQYSSLLAFFHRRIRNRTDAADLAQEVYVRMLRVGEPESIRDPQAYLFAVAGNLAKEQSLLDHRSALGIDIGEPVAEAQLFEVPDFEGDLDQRQRITRLRTVLRQLPLKCRTVVMLQYQHGLSHLEVADQLGISTHMVKKYLAQALAHCRRRMQSLA
jgi:RNA polymerase sigma-70 factor (ECF subfamily)